MPTRILPPADIFSTIILAPFGAVGVMENDTHIAGMTLLPHGFEEKIGASALAHLAAKQIKAYLASPRFSFSLPLAQKGTAFQQRVWAAIAAIPFGETRSYGEIARQIRSAPRAVGQACGANPFPLITPCHRVIQANRQLGGFAKTRDASAYLLHTKRLLLEREGVFLD